MKKTQDDLEYILKNAQKMNQKCFENALGNALGLKNGPTNAQNCSRRGIFDHLLNHF